MVLQGEAADALSPSKHTATSSAATHAAPYWMLKLRYSVAAAIACLVGASTACCGLLQ